MPNTYHRVGNGPHPVIVLHGWFGDAHSFEAVEPWLDARTFSYVFMDYRGYGGMLNTPGKYTIDEIASDALALADTLSFPSFSLMGHSMGGMAAERIAVRSPERVRALLAIAPVPCGGIAYDTATRRFLEEAAQSVAHRKTIINRSTGERLPSSWLDWKAEYSAVHSSEAAFAAYFQAWADTDFSEEINSEHPVKVLVGEHDPTFNADLMAKTYLRRYPHARLETLRNAGHYPMNETPLALVAAIESFLLESTHGSSPPRHPV